MTNEQRKHNRQQYRAIEQLYSECLNRNQELLEKAYRKTDELLSFIEDAKQVQAVILKNMQLAGKLLESIEGLTT